jgi:hypothetical protein
METKPLSPEKIVQIKNLLKEMDINQSNQSLIQDNKLIFTKDDKIYRCNMPNQIQQTEAEAKQNQLKVKLIQSDDTITRKRLIQVLKEKQNIDIIELEKNKEKLRKDLQDIYLDLAIVPSDNTEKIEEIRIKKNKIEEQFMEITIEIMELLSPCIEEQVKAIYYKYLAYACTEKQIKENEFKLIWIDYTEFEKDDTGLSYKAIEAIQTLLLNIKE